MLTAGALGLSSAREDRGGAEEDYERLEGRIEEYRTVLQQLRGTTSYDKLNQELEQRQETHDSEASQHKSDLAMYSATKSGVNSGEDALRQAESALDQGWEQYNQGFDQLQQGLTALNNSIDQSVTVNNYLTQFMSMNPSLPAPTTVEMPVPVPSALSETDTDPDPDPDDSDDPEPTPSPTPQVVEVQVYMKSDLVSAFNELADAYDQLDRFLSGASGLLSGLSATGALPAEQAAMLQQAQAGLDLLAQSQPGAVAGMLRQVPAALDSNPMLQGQDMIPSAAVEMPLDMPLAGGKSIKGIFEEAVGGFNDAKTGLGGMASMLPGLTETLRAAKKQLQEASGQLAQGRAALEQGDAQLAAGKAELQATENELERDGQRLDQEKITLEQEAQTLEQLKEKAEKQQDLEQRETSLRLMLLDLEGIQERVDGGMELLASAEDYGYQLQRESQEEYMNRFITCVIMIVGGLAGFACIPAAFEKLKSRFMLIAPAILSLLCAIAAETIFEVIGRGSSYSAIFAGVFAALYLLIVAPKAKKPAPKAAE